VALEHERAHDRLPLGLSQIDRDAALVAAERAPPEARVAVEMTPAPEGIAAERLDLDHLGAEVAEDHRGEGTGGELAELHDPEPGEGTVMRIAHGFSHSPTTMIARSTSVSTSAIQGRARGPFEGPAAIART